MNVEYSFSTPTTWTNPAMIASLEKLIKKAGFAGTVNQTVRIALTEAEAAAIEASTTQYRKGDIFLICDVWFPLFYMEHTNHLRRAAAQPT